MFNPPPALVETVAPTEFDAAWRKRLVRGSVHDERSALLGGVAGHAGLFSTSGDLAVYMTMLMRGGTYGGTRFLQDTTVAAFTRQQSTRSSRALGWDTKSPTGSTAGDLFSPRSYGHTGFTGTSIWVDPDRALCVVFLTNRVHPTRANMKIAKVRPALHNAVVRAIADH
jgi:CubicO group peptidase (beta-lactamase class C family)